METKSDFFEKNFYGDLHFHLFYGIYPIHTPVKRWFIGVPISGSYYLVIILLSKL